MKEKLILSVLVDNESGVLQRVASLFSRRNYNISSLTVSETEDPNFSRMTIETNTEPENFRQIKAQLKKLEIVKKVAEEQGCSICHLKRLLLSLPAQAKLSTDSLTISKIISASSSLQEQVSLLSQEVKNRLLKMFNNYIFYIL